MHSDRKCYLEGASCTMRPPSNPAFGLLMPILALNCVLAAFPLRAATSRVSMPAQDASQSTQEDQKSKKESPEKKTEEPPSRVFSRAIVPPKEWNPSKEHSVASPPEHLTGAATPATDNPSIPMGPHAAFVMEMYGPREEEISRRAWRYLLATREPATGFYDSVIHYPATTMWDMGSSMAALVSAERLKLLSTTSFQLHMRQLLKSLA